MRDLTAAQKAILARQSNLTLCYVVKVTWPLASAYYSDREITWSGGSSSDRLLGLTPIQYKTINKKATVVGTVSVTLIDTDRVIYEKLKSTFFERDNRVTGRQGTTSVTIYQYLVEQTAPTDFINLFEGVVASPVKYDEVARTVTFDVIPPLKSKVMPFVPTEDGVENADTNTEEEFWGQTWPMPFGKVVDYPIPQVFRGPRMKLAASIDNSTGVQIECETENDADPNPFSSPTTARDYLIGEEVVNGSFSSTGTKKKFTASTRNKAYGTYSLTTRPNTTTDPDAALSSVVYVAANNGKYPRLVGKWHKISTGASGFTALTPTFYNYCNRQVGGKCFFLLKWQTVQSSSAKLTGVTLTGYRYNPGTGYTWSHQQGTTIRIYDPNNSSSDSRAKQPGSVYIVSDVPLATNTATDGTDISVIRLRAYRNIPVIGGPNGGEVVRKLVRIPHGLYDIVRGAGTWQRTVAGATHKPVVAVFNPPLEDLMMGWDASTIYATVVPNVPTSNVRNLAKQIEWILTNYTDLSPDSTSFAAVASLISSFNADYALLSGSDAVQTCIDLAWQARCALIFQGKTVKIKYLSTSTPSASTPVIDSDMVLLGGATEFENTILEDLVTVFDAKYTTGYANGKNKNSTKRTNVNIFGEQLQTFNFSAYQSKGLVNASRDYWAEMYGNMWRYLRVTCLASATIFEPYDTPTVNMDSLVGWGGPSVKMRIDEITYNDNGTVTLLLWTGIKAGSTTQTGWSSVSAPTSIDPFSTSNMNIGFLADVIEALATSQDGN